MGRFTGLIGLVAILGVAYLFSSQRRAIRPRILLWGLGLQLAFALLVLQTRFGDVFKAASAGVNHMLKYAAEGSRFMFGDKLGGEVADTPVSITIKLKRWINMAERGWYSGDTHVHRPLAEKAENR